MDTQKQQVAQRVKEANNILVTVSNNPSVDQLAACIGLTLALNKMGKHATAVFSGAIPSTIEFLQPEKTIEKNTDSLRDFIIALDKSKADKLRYKVEDRVVKIFITPYRTSISDKDLEFSQGDFNVDVVLALGVHAQSELDQAITAHGRILHDATVVTMNVRPGGELGSLNWLEPNASSLSELAVQLLDMLDKKLMDGQIATSMLTGIVAETERFSNAKTSPGTMSISAELMAVGANQQLVATKLEEPAPPLAAPVGPIAQQDAHTGGAKDVPPEAKKPDDGTLEIAHDDKREAESAAKPEPEVSKPEAGALPEPAAESEPPLPTIHDVKSDTGGLLPPSDHKDDTGNRQTPEESKEEQGQQPQPPEQPQAAEPAIGLPAPEAPAEPLSPPQIHIDEHGALSPLVPEESDAADEALLPPLKPQEPPTISHHSEAPKMILEPPSLGGQLTANATSDAFGAAGDDEDAAAGLPGMPAHDMPMLGNGQGLPGSGTGPAATEPPSSLGNAPGTSFLGDQPLQEPTPPTTPAPNETLSDIERDVHSSHLGMPAPSAAATMAVPEPASATEPAFIETPVPTATSPAGPAPFAPEPVAPPPPISAAPPANTVVMPQVPVVGPDDLTPEEVANAFAVGEAPLPGAAPAPGFASAPAPLSGTSAAFVPSQPGAANYSNLDNARDAVADAINSSATPPLEPIQALNANPLNLPLGSAANQNAAGAAPASDPFAATPQPSIPVQPWTPPEPASPEPTTVPNPATQFDPAAFAQVEDPNAPPPVPPPMMPGMSPS